MTNKPDNTKERLYDILTSANYSSTQEITARKPSTNNDLGWLETLLEFLFGNGSPSSDIFTIVSVIIKGLLIFTLFFAIYWVIKHSKNLKGWLQRKYFEGLRSEKVNIKNNNPIHLLKSWEDLPEHDQIPNLVNELFKKGDTLIAMSILYRGSLRWLNDNEKLTILPANTEMQCINHIKKIQSINDIDNHISQYIIQVIKYWIPIAYDSNTDINQSKLIEITNQWNITLKQISQSQ